MKKKLLLRPGRAAVWLLQVQHEVADVDGSGPCSAFSEEGAWAAETI